MKRGHEHIINFRANFQKLSFVTRVKYAYNNGFAITVVLCLADTFTHDVFVFSGIREPFGVVQGGSFPNSYRDRMKFSAKTPCHRKTPKRYQYLNSTSSVSPLVEPLTETCCKAF